LWLKEGFVRFLEFVFCDAQQPLWEMWRYFLTDIMAMAMNKVRGGAMLFYLSLLRFDVALLSLLFLLLLFFFLSFVHFAYFQDLGDATHPVEMPLTEDPRRVHALFDVIRYDWKDLK
jgi:hypothetical protein